MCRELRWESKQRTQRRTDSYQRSTPALLDSRGREEMSGKGDRRENEGKFHPRFSSEKVAFPGIDALSNDSKLNMPGKLPVCSLELTSRLTISCCHFFPSYSPAGPIYNLPSITLPRSIHSETNGRAPSMRKSQ